MSFEGKLCFARHERRVFVRAEGRCTHALGADLEALFNSLFERADFDEIVMDLTPATALDSTMLGLVARAAKWMLQHRRKKLAVICPVPKVASTLRGVGLDRLVDIEAGDGSTPVAAMETVQRVEATRVERASTILEAHRELMALNEENAAAFKGVVEFLEQDLRVRR